MTESFYRQTVSRLLAAEWLRPDDEILVVAGGLLDHEVLLALGLRRVTISNLDSRKAGDEYAPHRWSYQNAEHLTYDDATFDVCIVHQGLHHCRSPHRGLIEMYRVARRGIVAFEPQETLLTRLGVGLGVGQRYEHAAVVDNDFTFGGVENSGVPNFVYRWTRREAHKTLATNDPMGAPRVQFFYDLRVPGESAELVRSVPARALARMGTPVVRALLRLAPSQANAIAIVADKLDPQCDSHPWVTDDDGSLRADSAWYGRGRSGAEPGVPVEP
ncbi:methyltransferase domain-containing protein [Mumia sp.]|uniref:class I SAM-dependent methyltransferase n=1 Tax=Mumia sp. TaxID=1965300 RepID=UPI00263544BD|nr:methyltransferase domain-containing protein [Mumia sp.]MDD9350585.1 methyltransferase domain-containing protein [Mumia sp.]